jgi:hypothetical protein
MHVHTKGFPGLHARLAVFPNAVMPFGEARTPLSLAKALAFSTFPLDGSRSSSISLHQSDLWLAIRD